MNKIEFRSISVSKLRLYLICPRRYYYAYGEGIFQKETPAILFGSFIHAVLEDYLKYLLKNFKSQDLESLYRIANEKKAGYDKIQETGRHSFFEADIILNKFASRKINPENIYAIEKFFKVSIPEEEIQIEGRYDRIDLEHNGAGGHLLHIIDYKTGKNELTEDALKEDLQMKFYITGAYNLYRKLYKRFRFSLYYLKNNSEVSFQTDYNNEYNNELSGYINTIKNDNTYSENPGKHCFYCPAFEVCKPDISSIKK